MNRFGEMALLKLSLHLEHVERSIMISLADYQENISKQIESAVHAHCQPEAVARLIEQEVGQQVDRAIQEEIKHFFAFGPGRAVVAEAVREKLSRGLAGENEEK